MISKIIFYLILIISSDCYSQNMLDIARNKGKEGFPPERFQPGLQVGTSNMYDTIFFEVGTNMLDSFAKKKLDSIYYNYIVRDKYWYYSILLTGRTDSTGSIESNNLLSFNRANIVSDYLKSKGENEVIHKSWCASNVDGCGWFFMHFNSPIDPSIRSFGENKPIVSENYNARINRSVIINLYSNPEGCPGMMGGCSIPKKDTLVKTNDGLSLKFKEGDLLTLTLIKESSYNPCNDSFDVNLFRASLIESIKISDSLSKIYSTVVFNNVFINTHPKFYYSDCKNYEKIVTKFFPLTISLNKYQAKKAIKIYAYDIADSNNIKIREKEVTSIQEDDKTKLIVNLSPWELKHVFFSLSEKKTRKYLFKKNTVIHPKRRFAFPFFEKRIDKKYVIKMKYYKLIKNRP